MLDVIFSTVLTTGYLKIKIVNRHTNCIQYSCSACFD